MAGKIEFSNCDSIVFSVVHEDRTTDDVEDESNSHMLEFADTDEFIANLRRCAEWLEQHQDVDIFADVD